MEENTKKNLRANKNGYSIMGSFSFGVIFNIYLFTERAITQLQ